jgi:hypothetical protein
MLRSLKYAEQDTASATDGDIKSVFESRLDDESWIVRNLLVHAGGEHVVNGRNLFISPIKRATKRAIGSRLSSGQGQTDNRI